MKFRKLREHEIELRIGTAKENGVSLLLYKDARCDMNILDETVGAMNWQRHHGRENANCIVSIYDEDKKQWIEKEDTGTESFTEKEKGLASDSFKRACFNWGIGRELYTSPFIWIRKDQIKKLERVGDKWVCKDGFSVAEIGYDENGDICNLVIENTTTNEIVFGYKGLPKTKTQKTQKPRRQEVLETMKNTKTTNENIVEYLQDKNAKTLDELTDKDYKELLKQIARTQIIEEREI